MLHEDIKLQTVELVRIVPEVGELALTPGELLRRKILDWVPFVGLVVLPTLLALIYCLALAANRYESEISYVVRTPGSGAASELAAVVQSSGITKSNDDAYMAKEFMLSRDGMQKLIDNDGLLAMFAQAGRDILWRPSLFGEPLKEELVKHYLRFVDVTYNTSTGVSHLTVQAFTPEDAQRLANALVAHTEHFLNNLNNRANQDAIKAAVADVDEAKSAAYAALDALTAFRNAEETVDPTKQSSGVVASISSLSLEVATSNARLAELMTSAPHSPEIPSLRTRIAALQDQIIRQRQQLGGDANSFAPRIERYQRLLLDQQFAEKAFISALSSLEAARIDASRQRIFIEQITTADQADRPEHPSRVLIMLGVFGLGLMSWWILHLLGRDAREHGRR